MPFLKQFRLLTSQLGFTSIAIVSFSTFFARTGGLFNLIPTLADMAPPGMNAPAMSMYRMLADFGYVAGPLTLGFAADVFATETALYATAAMVIVAGAAFAWLAPESYRRESVPKPVVAGR